MKNIFLKAARILRLAANDFKAKYAGSLLGALWAVSEPIVTVMVYWFVYSVAFGTTNADVPYYIWLSAGIAPWFFIDGGIRATASSFRDYSYLVKKVRFDIGVLPLVRTVSALISHLIFLGIVVFMCAFKGMNLKEIIYLPFMILLTGCFVFAVGRILAIVSAYYKDILNATGIIMNIGFWLTPIFWNVGGLSEKLTKIIMLNPAAVLVESYRGILISGENLCIDKVLYVGMISLLLIVIGGIYEKRSLKNIADSL